MSPLVQKIADLCDVSIFDFFCLKVPKSKFSQLFDDAMHSAKKCYNYYIRQFSYQKMPNTCHQNSALSKNQVKW